MKPSKKDIIKSEVGNKLQALTTVIDLLLEGKTPSNKLLQAAKRDTKRITRLIRDL